MTATSIISTIRKLLFDKQQEEILSEMDEIEQDLNTVIK